jgi:quercetin dioxygenase-like cupin family protein
MDQNQMTEAIAHPPAGIQARVGSRPTQEPTKGTQTMTTGQSFTFPDGSQFTVLASATDPRRDQLVMELILPPGCIPPPPHVHPHSSETFEVLDGALELKCEGKWHRLTTGERLTIKPGQTHTLRNRERSAVRVRNVHEPDSGHERYMRRMAALMHEHQFAKVTPRAAVYLATLDQQHRETIRPAAPLRVPMRALATIGRVMKLKLPD